MVNVRRQRCSHKPCTKHPSFNVESSKTRAYCRKHAEDGMVNVRLWRLSNVSRRAVPGRGVPSNFETTARTRLNTDLLDGSRINFRKRSRCTHDGKQPPHSLTHGPLKRGIVETAGMGRSNGDFHTSSSCAVRSEIKDDTVGSVGEPTRSMASGVLTPSASERHSGGTIKTEMELVVLF